VGVAAWAKAVEISTAALSSADGRMTARDSEVARKPSILGGAQLRADAPDASPKLESMVQTPGSTPRLSLDGDVATLTLRRPGLANRLGLDDIEALQAHFTRLRASPQIRLLVLRGEGPHFCAGFQIDALDRTDAPALFEALGDALEALPQLTLALVQGGCWGGAVDLALACDFRLGAARAQMGIPAARLGLHFYASGMQRLVTRLGLAAAKQLLLAAAIWDADEMLARGALDAVSGDLDALALQWQKRLLALAPLAQQGMKRHLNAVADGRLDTVQLRVDMARCAASADLAEGLAAWAAKRAPHFSGA
jgi:enoyl-CoA hydratase